MKKRADIGLSFGMIFSIIIIVATLFVGFYVIKYFLGLGQCTDMSLFYKDIDARVNKAWNTPISSETFTSNKIPGSVKMVCFGDLNKARNSYPQVYSDLEPYTDEKANLFLYPRVNPCKGSIPYYKINHAKIDGFFCVTPVNSKISIKLNKDVSDTLVSISK